MRDNLNSGEKERTLELTSSVIVKKTQGLDSLDLCFVTLDKCPLHVGLLFSGPLFLFNVGTS